MYAEHPEKAKQMVTLNTTNDRQITVDYRTVLLSLLTFTLLIRHGTIPTYVDVLLVKATNEIYKTWR